MSKRNTLVGPQLQRGRTDFNPDWKRLIAFAAVILLGSIVATQVLANSYGFHPALGFNLFHIYPPWSYFVWAHQWEKANNHTLFAQALRSCRIQGGLEFSFVLVGERGLQDPAGLFETLSGVVFLTRTNRPADGWP